MSLIPARSHTFAEIDHEIISTAILLPSADSKRGVVSYKGKYEHKVLVNCLVKLSQGKKSVVGHKQLQRLARVLEYHDSEFYIEWSKTIFS